MAVNVFPAASSGDIWTLISSATLTSGSTHTFSSISGYRKLRLMARRITSSGNAIWLVRVNGDSGNKYMLNGPASSAGADYTEFRVGITTSAAGFMMDFPEANQSVVQTFTGFTVAGNPSDGIFESAAAITSLSLVLSANTFSAGTLYLYGVAA
jgi:hypothetical protein